MKCSFVKVELKNGSSYSYEESKPNQSGTASQVQDLHLIYRDGMAMVNFRQIGGSIRINEDFHVGNISRILRTESAPLKGPDSV